MEFVYVVNRMDLFDLPMPHGFVGATPPAGHPSLETYLERIATKGYFVERSWAEQQSSVKQIIPYTLVCHATKLFLTRRLFLEATETDDEVVSLRQGFDRGLDRAERLKVRRNDRFGLFGRVDTKGIRS